MNGCGKCRWYIKRPSCENVCAKTGKIVGPLWERNCFEPAATLKDKASENNITDMEKIKTKVCSRCGRELPVDQFCKSRQSKDGYQTFCKECKSKLAKDRYNKKRQERIQLALAVTEAANNQDPLEVIKNADAVDLVSELRSRGYEVTCTRTIQEAL